MRRTGEIERHQLREAFRLDCNHDAVVRLEIKEGEEEAETIACKIVNISYGGARIALAEPLERGIKAHLLFNTAVNECVMSEVRSVVPVDSLSSQHKWFCGLQFEYDNFAQSRRVSQFVNEMQRQMLKSGRRPI
jgi:c-di-GMP-binding flagellar brake protein YcgR